MRLDVASRILRLFAIDRGLDMLPVMVVDRRLANPGEFAHVRESTASVGAEAVCR
jgi:hypothetical protein